MLPGGAFFHHNDSFLMIRGGHIDLALLGAFEVSADGNIANWSTNEPDAIPAVGGAMDLAVGAKEVWALLQHTTKDGVPRIRTKCTYPLTGLKCVKRLYTDLAVIDLTPKGAVVREVVEGIDFATLQSLTEAPLTLANDWRPLVTPRL
jgi:3-oxoadipate CoA-transferase beta subunit